MKVRRRLALPPLAVGLALLTIVAAAGPSRAALCAPPGCLWAELTGDQVVPGPGLARLDGTFQLLVLRDPSAPGVAGVAPPSSWPAIYFMLLVGNTNLDDVVTAVDLHEGRAGIAGEVVLSLVTEPWPSAYAGQPRRGWAGYILDFEPGLWDEVAASPADYYVDVHMAAFPDGAVRGQLRGTSSDTAMAPAGSTNEVLVLIGAMLLLVGVAGLAFWRPARASGS